MVWVWYGYGKRRTFKPPGMHLLLSLEMEALQLGVPWRFIRSFSWLFFSGGFEWKWWRKTWKKRGHEYSKSQIYHPCHLCLVYTYISLVYMWNVGKYSVRPKDLPWVRFNKHSFIAVYSGIDSVRRSLAGGSILFYVVKGPYGWCSRKPAITSWGW